MKHLKSHLGAYGAWAVVTGASDGIGKAMATELAQSGTNLVLVARRHHVLEQISSDLVSRFNIKTRLIDADLVQAQGVERVLEETQSLDVGMLITAAGFGTSGLFINTSLDQEIAMLNVNCQAVLAMTHAFAQRFVSRGRGAIVLLSSLVAYQGVPYSAHYAATKAYIQSFAEGLSYELAPLGVDVLATTPGPVNSGFAAVANMQMGEALDPETVARGTLRALGRKSVVRPGMLSKFLLGSLDMLPRPLRVRAMAQIMRGMTQHQPAKPKLQRKTS
jgi:uncharacterized protein